MSEGMTSDACVVIRMYNEARTVANVVHEARQHFDRVICVDDGSNDGSGALARAAGATVVTHPVNLGGGAALQTGLSQALRDPRNRYIVTLDADEQHDVQDALRMLEATRRLEVDVMFGSRFIDDTSSIPLGRRLLLRLATHFTRVTTGLPVTDAHCGLRVLRREVVEALRLRLHGMSYASELTSNVARHGWLYAEHPVTIRYTEYSRAKGQPGYNAANIVIDILIDRLRAAA